jgi:hypothetical protein
MDPLFEQASQFLDQALVFYAGGQIEEASRYLASAAAVLHQIQLAPTQPAEATATLGPVVFEPVSVVEMLQAATVPPAPAATPPVNPEPAHASSLAVAA